MLDEEHINLVHRFVFLPFVRKVLEQDQEKIKKANFKFEQTYLNIVERGILKLSTDLRDTKLAMKKAGLSVYQEGKTESGAYKYLVVHNGYRREISFLPHVIKLNVQEYIERYLVSLW